MPAVDGSSRSAAQYVGQKQKRTERSIRGYMTVCNPGLSVNIAGAGQGISENWHNWGDTMLLGDPLFDLNGDGKLSIDEAFLEFMVMQECLKEDTASPDADPDSTPLCESDEHGLPVDSIQHTTNQSNKHLSDEDDAPDYKWRDEYIDNPAGIDPLKYESLEDFLWVYEPVMDCMHETYTDLVKSKLSEFTLKYDLQLSAAIVYLSFLERLPSREASCAIDCLGKYVKQYGLTMEIIKSVVHQLKTAIDKHERDPANGEEFHIFP